MDFLNIFAIVIFVIVYVFISNEKVNKTIIVLLGASIYVIFGIISQENAYAAIDWNVIFLLIGMMITVGITKQTGVFQYIAIKTAKLARGNPQKILILLSLITAILSAFLDNVTTILILTPVTILITVELGVSPIPFIIAQAIASNIGGTATLVGDPPNIMIGSAANLSFNDFLVNLLPIVVAILFVFLLFMYFFTGKNMHVTNERKARIMDLDEDKAIENKNLLIKSLIVLSIVIIGFLTHEAMNLEASTIALFGASLLMLLTGSHEIDKFFQEVEWGTIFFFFGLFIMVGGLVELGIIKSLSILMLKITANNVEKTTYLILWLSGVLSAFVDNIPYVATIIPLIQNMGHHLGTEAIRPIWWSLSLGACLGGNGTLIGASANVLAVGLARKSGYKISFWDFTKYGLIITFVSLIMSTLFLYLRYFLH